MDREKVITSVVASVVTAAVLYVGAVAFNFFTVSLDPTDITQVAREFVNDDDARNALLSFMARDEEQRFRGLQGEQGEQGQRGEPGLAGSDGVDASIPSGTVAAFDLPNGCPFGWESFDAAQGRVIIGADGSRYRLPYVAGQPEYQTGGAEAHPLTTDEMPPHSHSVGWSSGGTLHTITLNNTRGDVEGDFQYRLAWEREAGQAGRYLTSSSEGAGVAHSNMQPFVVLYYCKKS